MGATEPGVQGNLEDPLPIPSEEVVTKAVIASLSRMSIVPEIGFWLSFQGLPFNPGAAVTPATIRDR
jgi:hypothetical protein